MSVFYRLGGQPPPHARERTKGFRRGLVALLSHGHKLVPLRGRAARKLLPFHVPRPRAQPLGGGEYLALAVAGVEGVHGGVQARLFGWRGSVEEVGLVRRAGLFESEEHDDLREHNGSLPAIEDLFYCLRWCVLW